MKKQRLDIVGKTFGRLTVIEYAYTNKHKQSMWRCKCECGNERIVTGSHLVNGHSKSCGCLGKELHTERLTKHGMRHTRIYRIWLGMNSRCFTPSVPCFKHYGGRGVTVCEEWRNSFDAFYEWAMANGYSEELTIDRIDVNGNYCPDNCRWATWKEQRNNQRSCVYLTHNGETHTIAEWSELTGINASTLYSRHSKGKSADEILKKKGV